MPRQQAYVGDEPTLGELLRGLERLENQTREGHAEVVTKIDDLREHVDATFVRKEVYDSDSEARGVLYDVLSKRIEALEARLSWVARGAAVAGLGVVISAGGWVAKTLVGLS